VTRDDRVVEGEKKTKKFLVGVVWDSSNSGTPSGIFAKWLAEVGI